MHAAALHCAACGKFRGWLRHEALDFLAAITARFGEVTEPITLRDQTIGDHLMTDKHYEPKNGEGALFKNTRKEKPAHPDYQGELKVENTAFRLSAWIKTAKSGVKYMHLPPPCRRQRRAARSATSRTSSTTRSDFEAWPESHLRTRLIGRGK